MLTRRNFLAGSGIALAACGSEKTMRFDPYDTVRWGDEKTFISTAAGVSGDLVRIPSLPPQLCRINFHGEVLGAPSDNPLIIVTRTILEMQVGCGSQTTTIRRVFDRLPQNGTVTGDDAEFGNVPLDVEWFMPLFRINARVTVIGVEVPVKYSLWITPLEGIEGAVHARP